MPPPKKLTNRDEEKLLKVLVDDLHLELLPSVYAQSASAAIVKLAELSGAKVATVTSLRALLKEWL